MNGVQWRANFCIRLADPGRIFEQLAAFRWTGCGRQCRHGISRSYPTDELSQISWGDPKSVKGNFHQSWITFIYSRYPRSTFLSLGYPRDIQTCPEFEILSRGISHMSVYHWDITGISLDPPDPDQADLYQGSGLQMNIRWLWSASASGRLDIIIIPGIS